MQEVLFQPEGVELTTRKMVVVMYAASSVCHLRRTFRFLFWVALPLVFFWPCPFGCLGCRALGHKIWSALSTRWWPLCVLPQAWASQPIRSACPCGCESPASQILLLSQHPQWQEHRSQRAEGDDKRIAQGQGHKSRNGEREACRVQCGMYRAEGQEHRLRNDLIVIVTSL